VEELDDEEFDAEEFDDAGVYNDKRMKAAVKEMKPFLTADGPVLSFETLVDVKRNARYIQFESPQKALEYTNQNMGKVQTWEHKVLLVLAFLGAAKENKIFYKKSKFIQKNEHKSESAVIASVILCETWMNEAVTKGEKCCTGEVSDLAGDSLMIVFLTEIATLIRNCTECFIDSATKLDTVNNKCGVHWEEGLIKMNRFASTVKSASLIRAVIPARDQLVKLRRDAEQREPVQEEKKTESPNKPAVSTIAKKLLTADEKKKIAREKPAASTIPKKSLADEKKKIARDTRRRILSMAHMVATTTSVPGLHSPQKHHGEGGSNGEGCGSRRQDDSKATATAKPKPNWQSSRGWGSSLSAKTDSKSGPESNAATKTTWKSKSSSWAKASEGNYPNATTWPTWKSASWAKTSERTDPVPSHNMASTAVAGWHTSNGGGNVPPSTSVDDRASASLPPTSAAHIHVQDNQSGERIDFQNRRRDTPEQRGYQVQRTENSATRREEGRAPAPRLNSEYSSRDRAREGARGRHQQASMDDHERTRQWRFWGQWAVGCSSYGSTRCQGRPWKRTRS